ncbi:hypothetical protein L1987_82589 [Smallanthus sonchifolius]|uniref:Uncharacterized protein n=1 Tax=Smallanthus sonchifolius TaxID=185202 RepID=A0ACB8YBY7_9ASTR|nr:hypothetical protein L1987_82589 [Smallanthus sonchifolius]
MSLSLQFTPHNMQRESILVFEISKKRFLKEVLAYMICDADSLVLRYLENLLEEKKSLAYVHGLPICNNLLNQVLIFSTEIARVSEIISNQDFNIFGGLQFGSPNLLGPLNIMPNFAAMNLGHWDGSSGWNPLQHQGFGGPQGPPFDHGNIVAASPSTLLTKKLLRLDVPVDTYPDFNFVGRLLGPRGNSLKRMEALTGCRIFIRGKGSMKDTNREERLRGKQRYSHLNEPLHVLIEAESPANEVDAQLRHAKEIILELLKPVDSYKRQQLRELAMLNSLCKEDTSQPSSSASPCSSGAKKCATKACKGTSSTSPIAQRTTL